MIHFSDSTFHLQTRNSSYAFRITAHGHLEHVHYGRKVPRESLSALTVKRTMPYGASVLIDREDPAYCLDTMPLEWSGMGRGDYRQIPLEMRMPDGTFVSDFRYDRHEIFSGTADLSQSGLPAAFGDEDQCQTLRVSLQDRPGGVRLDLYYTVFEGCNVITRRAAVTSDSDQAMEIRKCMSLMLDLPDRDFRLVSLHGAWIREARPQDVTLPYGVFLKESSTGTSSHRHNPAFLLAAKGADEQKGEVYGFNLVYSGSHATFVEKSEHGSVRVLTGLGTQGFSWTLRPGETFITPEAVMTHSMAGKSGMSHQFHAFIMRHIVPSHWQTRPRPIVYNSWEALGFDFNARRLLGQARKARRLGMELFVLDDGWFGQRSDDTAGLGDYQENRKKLPGGLAGLARKIRRLGLDFGLWVEPEMISEDSQLFREHPEFAARVPARQPAMGRNQHVLDLCNPKVQDHVIERLRDLLGRTSISYVKWDMNRQLSEFHSPHLENQGEFAHRYALGLYRILQQVFADRPQILLESCSSGGNRFDLGMLCHSPQIWASDNTDPIERLTIQGGLSLFYPPSTWGAHVSVSPHQQTLRLTPLATRFHAACFGCLGYELDLNHLSKRESDQIREQTAFYKKHRELFQFGTFDRLDAGKRHLVQWQVRSPKADRAIVALFQTRILSADSPDWLMPTGLRPATLYRVTSLPSPLRLSRFGSLVNHVSPIRLNPKGVVFRVADRFASLPQNPQIHEGSGQQLMAGIGLTSNFLGTGHDPDMRMLGDFDSLLHMIEETRGSGHEKEAEEETQHGQNV